MKLEILYTVGRFLYTIYERFFEDGCTYRSAALTYTTLLSLVPLMTVSFAIFSAFPVFSHISKEIQDFIFSHFLATSGEVIQTYLEKFVAQTKNLTPIGSIFLVVTAILMMFNMEQAFNAIWKVRSRRKGVSTFLMYWAVLTLSPILIGISLIISSYFNQLTFLSATAEHIGFMTALPFLLNLAFFTLIYTLIPNCHVPLRYGFIGALVATVLFSLAKWGFAYYVGHFPKYILLYGALATIPLFFIWVYVTWMIILFGVIISNILATGYRFRSTKKMDGFTHAYMWLGYFWRALRNGSDLSLQELIELDSCNYCVEPNHQLQTFLDNRLIRETKPGRYILAQELACLSLTKFAEDLPWRFPNEEELSQWEGKWIESLKKTLENRREVLTKFDHAKLLDFYL